MAKPPRRQSIPPRKSENEKRKIRRVVDDDKVNELLGKVWYKGISKHKRDPLAFGLCLYNKPRGDESLCDEHAGFSVEDMDSIPILIRRGLRAKLIGHVDNQGDPSIIWSIADSGWIFEARITNPGYGEYHGYPVRPTDDFAETIYSKFMTWVNEFGNDEDIRAAARCADLYRFKL